MPNRKNPDSTHAMKVLAAYWLLLFTGRAWSLPALADELQCSKQAVLRMMDNISLSGYAHLRSWREDVYPRRRWYQLEAPAKRPWPSLTADDIQTLLLCRDLSWNLLPESLRDTVSRAIGHATVLLPDFEQRKELPGSVTCAQPTGGVDYRDKGEVLNCLLLAMKENRVCEVAYQAIEADAPRVHRVAPRRLLPHKDSLFLTGWLIKDEDAVYQTTLAVHRIVRATLTDEVFEKPWPGERLAGFGVIKGEPFRVRAAFESSAACYVRERVWSEDQVLEPQPDGGVILEFTATSWPEVVAWALSFGTTVTVLKPEELRQELKAIIEKMMDKYAT